MSAYKFSAVALICAGLIAATIASAPDAEKVRREAAQRDAELRVDPLKEWQQATTLKPWHEQYGLPAEKPVYPYQGALTRRD